MTLPKEQPTEDQKRFNRFWFPLGTRLLVKEDEADAAYPFDGAVYTVTKEPWLAHEQHNDWTCEVRNEKTGTTSETFVTRFRRVP